MVSFTFDTVKFLFDFSDTYKIYTGKSVENLPVVHPACKGSRIAQS